MSVYVSEGAVLGLGKLWNDVSSLRVEGTNYINGSAGRFIAIDLFATTSNNSYELLIKESTSNNWKTVIEISSNIWSSKKNINCFIPPFAKYKLKKIVGSYSIARWLELSL